MHTHFCLFQPQTFFFLKYIYAELNSLCALSSLRGLLQEDGAQRLFPQHHPWAVRSVPVPVIAPIASPSSLPSILLLPVSPQPLPLSRSSLQARPSLRGTGCAGRLPAAAQPPARKLRLWWLHKAAFHCRAAEGARTCGAVWQAAPEGVRKRQTRRKESH